MSIEEAYQVMGLAYGASWEDIKKRFRTLAKKWHPDKSEHANAEQVFSNIAIAYERLEEWERANRPSPRQFKYADIEELARKKAEQQRKDAARRAELYRRARLRKLKKEREQAKEYRVAIGILLAFLMIYFGGKTVSKEYENYLIEQDPGMAYARIYNQDQNVIYYAFEVDGQLYTDELHVQFSRNSNRSSNGLPLHLNDYFAVHYYREDPTYHELDFMSPHPNTLELYISKGQNNLMYLFPQSFQGMSSSDRQKSSRCLILTVFDSFGYEGLANLTYSGESFWMNWSNNRGTFESMVDDPEFAVCFNACSLELTNPIKTEE